MLKTSHSRKNTMTQIQQSIKDLKTISDDLMERAGYRCGVESIKMTGRGFKTFFLSPDRQDGSLYLTLIKMKYRHKKFDAPYHWQVERGGVIISYTEGDVEIYKYKEETINP